MSKEEKKVNRRDFLFTASYTIGAVGVGAIIWPMIDQMNPDKAQQALATTEVDISSIEPGKSITVLWRGKQEALNISYILVSLKLLCHFFSSKACPLRFLTSGL